MKAMSSVWRSITLGLLVVLAVIVIMFAINQGRFGKEVVQEGKNLFDEGAAHVYGMESYVYGYPMVVMDVTREVLTAAPAPNSEGTGPGSVQSMGYL